jgi:hypothetical protein
VMWTGDRVGSLLAGDSYLEIASTLASYNCIEPASDHRGLSLKRPVTCISENRNPESRASAPSGRLQTASPIGDCEVVDCGGFCPGEPARRVRRVNQNRKCKEGEAPRMVAVFHGAGELRLDR